MKDMFNFKKEIITTGKFQTGDKVIYKNLNKSLSYTIYNVYELYKQDGSKEYKYSLKHPNGFCHIDISEDTIELSDRILRRERRIKELLSNKG